MSLKRICLGLGFTMMLSACNKDQQVVNQLVGDWELVNIQVFDSNNTQIPQQIPQGVVYHFEDCNQKLDGFCTLKITRPNTNTEHLSYRIADKGDTFLMDTDNESSSTEDQIPARIDQHSKSNFVFHYTKIINNQPFTYKLSLQK